ncbi:ribonuclease III domain-containing protein [Methanolobus bombayensis]|uniref:ribonuclease III domain-containing protein n=1 Tax=Methanolobus bombayensis TaxID=38023 RepID=UPI001AE9DA2B|nr:ribonuclease III domain-containing protein [Methanolobus bombayensis]MBP1908555.1 dsRNA-specific ribonuclease [Methanolobus bombayensis]
MINKSELQKFFLLENDQDLFEKALRPRSCGGNAEFEQLALYGDSVINMHLYNYFIDRGWMLKGQINGYKETIHKESVIKVFAEEFLGIQAFMHPLDRTYSPEERDLAESFEALLGAAFKENGLDACKPIVYRFIDFTLEEQKKLQEQDVFDPSQNYKGKLLELFQAEHLEKPVIEPKEELLPNGRKAYQFIGNICFKGVPYEVCTSQYSETKKAEQEASYIALCRISRENPEYGRFDPALDTQLVEEVSIKPKASLDCEELVFYRMHSETKKEVSTGNGELLVDWANRKAKKDALRMLILLSGRLTDVSTTCWLCETIEGGLLCLINLRLGDEMYFAFGTGSSNTQAKKNAGKNMMVQSNVIHWIEEHYAGKSI